MARTSIFYIRFQAEVQEFILPYLDDYRFIRGVRKNSINKIISNATIN